MKCQKCGKIISDKAMMCPYCNQLVESAPTRPAPQRPVNTGGYSAQPRTSAPVKTKTPEKKKSVLLLISAILGVLYAIYSIFYWGGASSGAESAAAAVGTGIAAALVMPHLICAVLAAIFNVLGWAMNSRGFALTGAILYAVAMVMFPVYFMFVIIQMILSFIGFARLKNLNG